MSDIALITKLAVIGVALIWILRITLMRRRSALHLTWAVFCGGLATLMVREISGDSLGVFQPWLVIASCCTCGMFWLVARALFRPGASIGLPQIALVGGIFAPTALRQGLESTGVDTWMGAAGYAGLDQALGGLVTLLSSTVLVLSFWEGIRGWTPGLSINEKRMRGLYLATFGLCVSTCVMLLDHGEANLSPELMAGIQAACALSILTVTSVAVRYRELHPLKLPDDMRSRPVEVDEETRQLARRIRALMDSEEPYLDPGLKVGNLARRLHTPDYRVSRAITAGLGESNFNRFVNAYRVQAAQRKLADPAHAREPVLTIALDSGFASLGPFNRAFKAETGTTPREYRRQALASAPSAPAVRTA